VVDVAPKDGKLIAVYNDKEQLLEVRDELNVNIL